MAMHAAVHPNCNRLPNHLNDASYPVQNVGGPIQDDEAVMLFGMVRTMGITRILELGGKHGYSAQNFLQAMNCVNGNVSEHAMYTVDYQGELKAFDDRHHLLIKDAIRLTAEDVDNTPLGMVFLDCHSFYASLHVLKVLTSQNLLTKNALVAFHDTGLHQHKAVWFQPAAPDAIGFITQPTERILAQWLVWYDESSNWQRISFHDDVRQLRLGAGQQWFRHGITILQRRADLFVPSCHGWPAWMELDSKACRMQKKKKHPATV